jgi:AraC-like DNA-binding protein
VANIYPSIVRSLLGLIEERGHSPERLCRGLGFHYRDLRQPELLLSYLQARALIVRAQDLLGAWALGLASGARQSPVSWGLPGLAMLTCETFGEAIEYGQSHQGDAGAMMDHLFEVHPTEISFEVLPRVFDQQIEPFLVEDALCSLLSVSRHLVGHTLKPLRVELGFKKAGAEGPYARFFRGPVQFGAGRHRISFDSRWLDARLPGYDAITSRFVRHQLDPLLNAPAARHDLVETVSRRIRFDVHERPSQAELARQSNVSERTLRRRLGAQATSFRRLRDETLYAKACDLLSHTDLSVAEVAHHVGYADAAAFRRAFRRWSGQLPTYFRRQA